MRKFILTTFVLLTLNTLQTPATATYQPYYNPDSATALAQLVWAEGRGIPSDTEKAAIMWVVINRVEKEGAWANDLWTVITAKGQFAYNPNAPVDPDLYTLAKDVLIRWDKERCGFTDVGRTLPNNYYYFTGDGKRNYFRAEYRSNNHWDWSLPSPYNT